YGGRHLGGVGAASSGGDQVGSEHARLPDDDEGFRGIAGGTEGRDPAQLGEPTSIYAPLFRAERRPGPAARACAAGGRRAPAGVDLGHGVGARRGGSLENPDRSRSRTPPAAGGASSGSQTDGRRSRYPLGR